MNRLGKAALGVCIGVVGAQTARFEPRPAASYPARQSNEGVTIAVEPFDRGDKVKTAFGKANPERYGTLPMLVVMTNDSDRAVQLSDLRVTWITGDGQKIEPIPAEEVALAPLKRPDLNPRPSPSPIPGVNLGRKPKEPPWEFGAREFVARILPAKSNVHGFFYFRVGKGPDRLAGSRFYLTGLRDAATGRDLLYFEISLDPYVKAR